MNIWREDWRRNPEGKGEDWLQRKTVLSRRKCQQGHRPKRGGCEDKLG
jgi:hypothetical protein